MRIPRIHTTRPLQADTELVLEPGPSQHLSRVLRLAAGASLLLFDGAGREFSARILASDRKRVTVLLLEQQAPQRESPLWIHLGIGISRGDRMDWVVQKATELGVAAITPLFTGRTEVRLQGERQSRKRQHWQQVAISACEQSGRATLPRLSEPALLAQWLQLGGADRRFVLHHRATGAAGINTAAAAPRSVSLLVGPEGGLDEAEIQAAEAAGFEALALGPRVLRTETAPLAALAILQARWGDMGGLL
ncbi:16S rRNA (uracil(1498)-N(3))-methyltransferase [Kineobactrum salinum]|uniref:Ribosomal RNA small subunit methyltransferase E n=1 Tax=Kineobactrum salinum TaxID=2708301 RepID=A0A6C0U7R6_9GAMM|nr:16S rRNA (uracil(1498)-N(3))-methyltransferase [Kineobactrum salinum]QIB65524.1 16S rRNA (uracil(1498)-N(3))-methyltransferase [Kineobactrum salinum]